MTERERIQLLAVRSQTVATLAMIDAMLGVGEATAGATGGRCPHPESAIKTFGGGFGADQTATRICGQCGDTVS